MRTVRALVFLGYLLAPSAAPTAAEAPLPRSEHPRPDLRREGWKNLNGSWRFCFDPGDRGLHQQWPEGGGPFDRRITVPFPWESRLSGMDDALEGPIGWYRRTLRVPESWRGGQVWLCFGGVLGEARVWVDGRPVGRQENGAGPFAMDITDFAPPGSEARLDVRVRAADRESPAGGACAAELPPGSGIWQTVWLESRPPVHVADLRLAPGRAGGRWVVEVEVELAGPDGPAEVAIRSPDPTVGAHQATVPIVAGGSALHALLEVARPKPWSPDRPHVYDLEVSVADRQGRRDLVRTYFALRTIARGVYGNSQHEGILLNGEPLYLRGAVDPSLNAEGLVTAPSDEFLRRDVELARRLGLNLLKVRGAAPEPRRQYWADKLGVLLWRTVPLEVNAWQFAIDDYWIAREHIGQVVARPRPAPAPARADGRARGTAPLVCGPFTALPPEGGDVSWALRFLITQLRRHSAIQGHVVGSFYDVPGRRDGLLRFDRSVKAFGYDAFVPGMTLADLHRCDFIGFDAPPIIEAAPGEELTLTLFAGHYSTSPGPATLRWQVVGTDEFGRPVAGPSQTREVSWRRGSVAYQAPLRVRVPEGAPLVGALTAELLDAEGERIAANYVNLVADRAAAIDFTGEPNPPEPLRPSVEVLAPRLVAVRIPPGEPAAHQRGEADREWFDAGVTVHRGTVPIFAAQRTFLPSAHPFPPRKWDCPLRIERRKQPAPPRERLHAGQGLSVFAGREVEYRVALPGFVRDAIPAQMVLMAELAACTAACTTAGEGGSHTAPAGSVGVYLWDHELWQVPLPNDPADSRGVLSHHARFRQGHYGELVRRRVDLTHLPALREKMYTSESFPLVFRAEGPRSGVLVYGRRLGRYMVDPTLIIQTARPLERPVGFVAYDPVAVDRP